MQNRNFSDQHQLNMLQSGSASPYFNRLSEKQGQERRLFSKFRMAPITEISFKL